MPTPYVFDFHESHAMAQINVKTTYRISLASKGAEYFLTLNNQHKQQKLIMMNWPKISEKALGPIYLVSEVVAKTKSHTQLATGS